VDLWDLTRLLIRRWYFAVPMLLASVAAVVVAAQTVSPDYKAMGYMQLIPAPSTGKPQDPDEKPRPPNPWLDLGYAALGNAAALTVTDPTSLEKLADDGFSDSVTVVLNDRTPLFEIEAVGHTEEQATGTVQQIIELLQDDIAAKQKQYGTLPEDTISTLVINDGSSPQQESGKVKRVLIVAAGLGVLMTTASTITLDYWLRRRSRRRAGDDGRDDDAVAASEPVPVGTPEAAEPGPAEPGPAEAVRSKPGPAEAVRSKPGPAEAVRSKPGRAEAVRAEPVRSGTLDAERPRFQFPTRPEPLPRQSARANGSVYSSERRVTEGTARAAARPANGVRESAGPVEPETGLDGTVILPPSHPARHPQEKRP
jgi:hypothetical protein